MNLENANALSEEQAAINRVSLATWHKELAFYNLQIEQELARMRGESPVSAIFGRMDNRGGWYG